MNIIVIPNKMIIVSSFICTLDLVNVSHGSRQATTGDVVPVVTVVASLAESRTLVRVSISPSTSAALFRS